MKKDTITLSYDSEKLRATKRYMEKKGLDLEKELAAQIDKCYEKYVPSAVQTYLQELAEEGQPTKKVEGNKL